jgi:hypothetical protein
MEEPVLKMTFLYERDTWGHTIRSHRKLALHSPELITKSFW